MVGAGAECAPVAGRGAPAWPNALGLFVVAAVACGDSAEGAGSSGSGGGSGSGGSSGSGGGAGATGDGACDVLVQEHPPDGAAHVAACSAVDYASNPASGGEHYGVWPAFRTYDFPVPEGFVVHALEHGAVVLWYDCSDGCSSEVAEAQAFVDALPEDPACADTGVARRVILVPRPGLATRWAASSWGFTLNADCFDARAFRSFFDEHYGRGPEDLCAAGQAFSEDPCL